MEGQGGGAPRGLDPEAGDRGVCESCARDDDDLEPVRRVYLPGDEGGVPTVVDALELWCFSCRTMYPHEPLERG